MSENEISGSSPEPEDIEKETYVNFSVDALRHVSREADESRKFAEVGAQYNMCFKMLKSDSRLVKSVLFSYGFIQCSAKNQNFNVFWTNTHLNSNSLRQLKSWQRVNHFPRSFLITKKDDLYTNIRAAQAQYGENIFDFMPESYNTPLSEEKRERIKNDLSAAKETGCSFILKPSNSSRGRGIMFVSKPEQVDEIKDNDKVIVSRYISNPYLVEKKKSDLRVYVAVTSFYPLMAYMYTDGLTRFAVEEYDNDENGLSQEAQLTNYSLHKTNEKFIKNTSTASESHGHKWTLGAMFRHMKKDGKDTDLLIARIEDLVVKTLLSIQRVVASTCKKLSINPRSCFELFGFDILVDDDMKPWLLEVNLSPSLACDAPLDSIIKTHLICDTLNLCCVPLVLKKNTAVTALMGTVHNPIVDELAELASNASIGSDSAAASPATADSGYDTHSAASDNNQDNSQSTEEKPGRVNSLKRKPLRKNNLRSLKLKKAQQFVKPVYDSGDLNTAYNSRLDLFERKIRAEEKRTGDFIRIFPRPESLLLYGRIVEDTGAENWDKLLHQRLYGEEPEYSHKDYLKAHEELLNAKDYPTKASLSTTTRNMFLKSSLATAKKYLAPFYENETDPYPAALPKLRPTARRRTRSQLDFDIKRRAEMLEAREKAGLV
ncbi:unnamed protein product [Bursaphelenchus xylophilus]|uniref:Tubulin--tyrosine ligase-like protein 5 n=1 Tax=Bursaphelenchus xylophilus TaxID=6326 RepID=A0A1I7RRU0_BURXY|nr:unnamed protein product [Bursaphelenchus xylophilus]CAG9123478.1 unnamed protein product [Bursaphelenchus xylophilus]